jgi:hypothetical protein
MLINFSFDYNLMIKKKVILYNAFGKSLCTCKTRSSIERTIVSKNWIKQLNSSPVLLFNRCLTTEYSETTAHFNGNFDTDSQIYVPYPKCTATFLTHCISALISSVTCSVFVGVKSVSYRSYGQEFVRRVGRVYILDYLSGVYTISPRMCLLCKVWKGTCKIL